ncbi:MAG: hypothetical protein ABIJ57_01750 [Pseudomonadota bacterium]
MPYISKTQLSKGLRIPRPVIDQAVRDLGIQPNGKTAAGQPSYWLDQATVEKIIDKLREKNRISPDATFDVSQDPASQRKIPADMRRLDQGNAVEDPEEMETIQGPPAADPEPRKHPAAAATGKALAEYGTPTSVCSFRYYKVGTGGPSFQGEHSERLTIAEIKDQYGVGYYNIEQWSDERKVNTWRRFKVGDASEPDEIEEEPEEDDDDEPAPAQGSMFPPVATSPNDPLKMIEAFAEMQKKTLELLERREPREPAKNPADGWIGQVLTFMQKQSEEADKAHARRMDEIDRKHGNDMVREREYLAALDSNGKELQKNLMSVADRERAMNEKFMGELRASIADQRNAVREERDSLRVERTKVMDDVEDFTRRLKESALGGSPLYGLIQHGLSEARNVAGQLMSLRTGGTPTNMLPGPGDVGQAEAGRSLPAPRAGGIFDEMQRSKMLQDFLVLVSLAIQAESNPEDLADAFVGQVLQDPSGQAHMVYNFFVASSAATIADKLRPPVEVADPLRSKAGDDYWKIFKARLRFAMETIRMQGRNAEIEEEPDQEPEAPENPEKSENPENPVEGTPGQS